MPATLDDIQRKYGGSVYPLYKDVMHEPYMENDGGTGYQGVVLYDDLSDKVQCADCEEWFGALCTHVVRVHGYKDAREYKEKQGLFPNTPLCVPRVSESFSNNAKHLENLSQLMKTRKSFTKGDQRAPRGAEHYTHRLMLKNRNGYCDAQIAGRLAVVRAMIGGGEITSGAVRTHDVRLYNILCNKYGTVKAACGALGLVESRKGTHFRTNDVDIVADLRRFVVGNKRIPRWQETGHSLEAIRKYLGSWARAKMMAGLDQLLEEVKGNEVGNIGDSGSHELSHVTVDICDTK